MRVLKLVLAAAIAVLAITFGLVAVAVFAAALVGWLLGRSLLRRFRGQNPPAAGGVRQTRPAATGGGEIIDIAATEVPTADPARRELR